MNGLISLDSFSVVPVEKELMELNEYTAQYGLTLTAEEAHELSETRERGLSENERLEIGSGITPKIVKTFAASRYMSKDIYAYILNEMTYYFYFIKTETDDKVSDDVLLAEMFERFELFCRGNMDTFEGREVERIIRKFNSGEHYYEWYKDRDELDYTAENGSREANAEFEETDELYGSRRLVVSGVSEDELSDDTPADHDKYVADFGDFELSVGDEGYDMDVFDEFRDSETMNAELPEAFATHVDEEEEDDNG